MVKIITPYQCSIPYAVLRYVTTEVAHDDPSLEKESRVTHLTRSHRHVCQRWLSKVNVACIMGPSRHLQRKP